MGRSSADACANLDRPIGEIDRRGTVRNHQHEAADTELAYRSKRALLCRRVEMRGGLVQQEEIRSALGAQEATRERDALTLSSGEVGTVLRDAPARVQAFARSLRQSCCNFGRPWHRVPRVERFLRLCRPPAWAAAASRQCGRASSGGRLRPPRRRPSVRCLRTARGSRASRSAMSTSRSRWGPPVLRPRSCATRKRLAHRWRSKRRPAGR